MSMQPQKPEAPRWDDVARLLEQATRAGLQDPATLVLLARAYKNLNRPAEARQMLARIATPGSDVFLQRGLLAFQGKEYNQAADDFTSSLQSDPTSFAAAYNIVLARLWGNQLDAARIALDAALPLAPNPGEKRFLELVHLLLHALPGGTPSVDAGPLLASLTEPEELRLLDLLTGLGRFEVAYPLLARLVGARPQSGPAFRAFFAAVLVQAKAFLDRNQWEEAKLLLAPVRRRIEPFRATLDPLLLIALYQMLGVCSAMLQDFDQAIAWFRLAHEICSQETARAKTPREAARLTSPQGVPQIAGIEQNLALVHDWLNRVPQAEAHWKRYVDLLEQNLANSRPSDHLAILAFECLLRLAEQAQKQERWNEAVEFFQRAHRFRPTDYDTLEKLFNLHTQLRKPDEARKILRRMREVRPNDPQVELFELDVRDVRTVEEVEKVLQDLRRVAQKFPGDARVDERARSTLQNLVPTLEKMAEGYNGQVHKVVEQMRRLPSYQVNWPVVRDVMRDLEEQYTQLRRATQRMLAMALADDQRRDLQRLIAHCDRKIDQCASLAR